MSNSKLSYVYLTDMEKVNAIKNGVHANKDDGIVYFDTMILTNKTGVKSVITAYGDGAHVRDVGFFKDGGNGEFLECGDALHNMQVERYINEASDILALAEGKVVYKFRSSR